MVSAAIRTDVKAGGWELRIWLEAQLAFWEAFGQPEEQAWYAEALELVARGG